MSKKEDSSRVKQLANELAHTTSAGSGWGIVDRSISLEKLVQPEVSQGTTPAELPTPRHLNPKLPKDTHSRTGWAENRIRGCERTLPHTAPTSLMVFVSAGLVVWCGAVDPTYNQQPDLGNRAGALHRAVSGSAQDEELRGASAYLGPNSTIAAVRPPDSHRQARPAAAPPLSGRGCRGDVRGCLWRRPCRCSCGVLGAGGSLCGD